MKKHDSLIEGKNLLSLAAELNAPRLNSYKKVMHIIYSLSRSVNLDISTEFLQALEEKLLHFINFKKIKVTTLSVFLYEFMSFIALKDIKYDFKKIFTSIKDLSYEPYIIEDIKIDQATTSRLWISNTIYQCMNNKNNIFNDRIYTFLIIKMETILLPRKVCNSKVEDYVYKTICSLNIDCKKGAFIMGLGSEVDLVIPNEDSNIVIQVDGPYHYIKKTGKFNNATLLNTWLIEKLGFILIRISSKVIYESYKIDLKKYKINSDFANHIKSLLEPLLAIPSIQESNFIPDNAENSLIKMLGNNINES